ncbi:MAG: N-6 DNA methylase [Desulfobacterales bacterium]|nr:N-6 DNA methylase [Desulfobacterales bacterium]
MNLSSTIKSIQDIMRKDDGVDGDAQRIGQLSWMLFLKVFDQREEEWENDASDRGKIYESPLPEECRWRNWAACKDGKPQIQAGDLIEYVNSTVFPGLSGLNTEGASRGTTAARAKVVRDVFLDSNNYMKSGTLLLGVIEKLDEAINFHDFKARQNLGDIYEQILNDLRSAGNAGEFYTPRAVTQFMVHMVNPRLKKQETLLDPACGTGGFLTATIDYLNGQLGKKNSQKNKKIVEASIRGIEKKQLPHLLCITNLLLHGIDLSSQIERRNTLAKGWDEWSENEQVDCVITNPPFGGMEDSAVGADYPADVRTRETADMFLILIVKKLLKDGGRGAIVLPDGTLFGEGVKSKIKEYLLKECNLHTIIRLPNGVFSPYTGIKTNLLFFTKGKPTETIWFYEHPYPEGYKSYSKTKPLRFEEFEAEKAWWGREEDDFSERVENEFAWKIDFKAIKQEAEAKAIPCWDKAETLNNEASDIESRIKKLRGSVKGTNGMARRKKVEKEIGSLHQHADKLKLKAKDEQAAGNRIYWPIYNLDSKNPNSPEAEIYDPDELLVKYKKLLLDIEETENLLKDELASALAHHFEEGVDV